MILWVVTPSGLVKMEAVCSSETLIYRPTNPRGITTHMINIDIFTAVRTSNLK
jgi:hypothetical protein